MGEGTVSLGLRSRAERSARGLPPLRHNPHKLKQVLAVNRAACLVLQGPEEPENAAQALCR